MRKIRKFFTVIKTGFSGVWKNKSMGLASIISISAVSIILGIVLIAALTMNVLLKDVQTKVDEIELYIKDEVTEERVSEIGSSLEAQEGIKGIRFKTKDAALEEMKKSGEKMLIYLKV